MKKNYGLKVGDRFKTSDGMGTLTEIAPAGKHGLGFLHGYIKKDNGRLGGWWSLSMLAKIKENRNDD